MDKIYIFTAPTTASKIISGGILSVFLSYFRSYSHSYNLTSHNLTANLKPVSPNRKRGFPEE